MDFPQLTMRLPDGHEGSYGVLTASSYEGSCVVPE